MPVPCARQRFSVGVTENCCPALETDLSMSIAASPANGNIMCNNGSTCCPLSRVVSLCFPGGAGQVLCRGSWGRGRFPFSPRIQKCSLFTMAGAFACDYCFHEYVVVHHVFSLAGEGVFCLLKHLPFCVIFFFSFQDENLTFCFLFFQ